MAKGSEPSLGSWELRVHAHRRACLNESREGEEQGLAWVGGQRHMKRWRHMQRKTEKDQEEEGEIWLTES